MTRRILALAAPLCAVALAACGSSSSTPTVTQTVTAPASTAATSSAPTQGTAWTATGPASTDDNTGTVKQVIDQFHCETVYPNIDYTQQVSDAQQFWDCKWLDTAPEGEVMVADFGSEAAASDRYQMLTQKGMFAMRRGSVVVVGQTRADIATARARWK